MKYAKYNIENNSVEVYNSILGIESVNVNGREVSNGFSFFGRDHQFKIGRDSYKITPRLSINNYMGVAISIYKNGERIRPGNTISKFDKSWLIVRLVSEILIGGFIGWNIGPALEWVLQALAQ